MREIKFRGFHIHISDCNKHLEGRWVFGYLTSDKTIFDESLEGDMLVDPESVGEYTGLLDNDGNDIYEHDIVRYIDKHSGKECIGKVFWHVPTGSWDVTNRRMFTRLYEILDDGCKVIGNTYENPELNGGTRNEQCFA